MTKHDITLHSKEGSKASIYTRKATLKLEKMRIQLERDTQTLQIVKVLLANPAIAGAAAWLIVDALEKMSTGQKLTGQQLAALSQAETFVGNVAKNLPAPFNAAFSAGSGFGLGVSTGNTGYEALKLALLAYIATGGNLSGTIASAGSLLTAIK